MSADGPKKASRRARVLRWLAAALALAVLLFLSTFLPSPLPMPAPYGGALPPASPPAEMSLAKLPTGVTHRSAAFGYRGGSFFDRRDFSMTALLVRHPRGDLLIDTGFGRRIDTQLALMPFWFRWVTSFTRARAARDQLDAAGYDVHRLRAILLTHAHWDHTSGLPDFPETPVWVTREEHGFVRDGGYLSAFARQVPDARFDEYGFEGGPYLGFARSHDVYGDGSVVVVPAPGHTPGSVIVFLALPGGARYALVGDLAWQREGITQREERPWLQRTLGDSDPAEVRDGLLRMAALHARFPRLVLVPAHDARGFSGIPSLAAQVR